MPLDPQIAAYLAERTGQQVPAFHELGPEGARKLVAAESALLGAPEPLESTRDRTIPGPDSALRVRIYSPLGHKCPTGPVPALVYFHGGGWVVGRPEDFEVFCAAVANRTGFVVVAPSYRLAPEHPYPAAVEDAAAALEWVRRCAAELGIHPERIAVGGDSAGGNLAAVVCLRARDLGHPMPAFQWLLYPVTDYNFDRASYHEFSEGYLLSLPDMQWFWDLYVPDKRRRTEPYASPLRAGSLAGLPGALVVTAEFDPLRDEGEAYAARLAEHGVPVVLKRYEGMIHGFLRRAGRFDRARLALDELAGILKQALETEPGEQRA